MHIYIYLKKESKLINHLHIATKVMENLIKCTIINFIKNYKSIILITLVDLVNSRLERTGIWLRRYSDFVASFRKRVIVENNDS